MGVRTIDIELCTGCGLCILQCPMDVFRLDTFIDREEAPPCQEACPAGVNMRGYIYLVTQRRYDEAIALIRQALPLPAVTGHVCFHPCESECARKQVDEAVNINALERFVADYWIKEKAKPIPKVHAEKVAIVGSGPAGLAAAYELAKMGYPVTVFESLSVLGGMLRVGIPEFRLPRDVLDAQINYIKDMGVEFRTNTSVTDLGQLSEQGYKSIFLGTGAGVSQKMEIPGEDTKGVIHALDFLKQVNSGVGVGLGDRVAVIGGGNAAIDAARVALRLGASEVTIVYRRSRDEMPAAATEVDEAKGEGIRLHILAAPVRVLSQDGRLTGIECTRIKLGEPDASGRRRPVPVKGSEFVLDVDNVIIAIGEAVDKAGLPKDLTYTGWGTISVDPITFETNISGVFAGGDAVLGPASVVEAIAAGKKAAISIARYLRGEDLKAGREAEIKRVKEPPKEGVEKKARQAMPLLPLDQRRGNFREVKIGFNEEIAFKEAQRCMACGSKSIIKYLRDCQTCALCEGECPKEAIYCFPFFERRVVTAWT